MKNESPRFSEAENVKDIPVETFTRGKRSESGGKTSRSLLCMDCGYKPEVTFPGDRNIHGPIGQLKWPLKVSGTSEALTCPDCGSKHLRKSPRPKPVRGFNFASIRYGGVFLDL